MITAVLDTFLHKKMYKNGTVFLTLFRTQNVVMNGMLEDLAVHDTCQEIESEIFLKFCEKIVVFRCRKNYRLDLLRCMPAIRKLKKNEVPLFWTKKTMSLFWQKMRHFFVSFFWQKKGHFFVLFTSPVTSFTGIFFTSDSSSPTPESYGARTDHHLLVATPWGPPISWGWDD